MGRKSASLQLIQKAGAIFGFAGDYLKAISGCPFKTAEREGLLIKFVHLSPEVDFKPFFFSQESRRRHTAVRRSELQVSDSAGQISRE